MIATFGACMSDDRHKIVDRLQSTLRNEYIAATCYERHAEYARTLARYALAESLDAMATDHKQHIERISARIRELGGSPTGFDPPEEMLEKMGCLPKDDFCHALEQDLRFEDTEIEDYQILVRQSDERTASLCGQNIRDDREHLRWLRDQVVRELDELVE